MEKKRVFEKMYSSSSSPDNAGHYETDSGRMFYSNGKHIWTNAAGFEVIVLWWLKEQELYAFSSDEFNVIARMIYDACWNITGDGWNGETNSFAKMSDKDKDSYRQERNTILKSLGIK